MIGMIDFLIVSCLSLFSFAAGWIAGRISARTNALLASPAERELNEMINQSRTR